MIEVILENIQKKEKKSSVIIDQLNYMVMSLVLNKWSDGD